MHTFGRIKEFFKSDLQKAIEKIESRETAPLNLDWDPNHAFLEKDLTCMIYWYTGLEEIDELELNVPVAQVDGISASRDFFADWSAFKYQQAEKAYQKYNLDMNSRSDAERVRESIIRRFNGRITVNYLPWNGRSYWRNGDASHRLGALAYAADQFPDIMLPAKIQRISFKSNVFRQMNEGYQSFIVINGLDWLHIVTQPAFRNIEVQSTIRPSLADFEYEGRYSVVEFRVAGRSAQRLMAAIDQQEWSMNLNRYVSTISQKNHRPVYMIRS